ncbi:acyltransferase [Gordonia sp. GONU]|uniref:acyltransferase n=1 Tax=Gordonia sp. GONU TaxID=2972949 RepID=UPI0021AC601A|nr:acyltransferase [Gordonia sp. GONU]MCR8899001.1 acyltransferase [Gordonia sp. GONU]
MVQLRELARRLRNRLDTPEGAARRAGCVIGNDVRLYSRIENNEPWLVEIGDRVTVSSGVRFVTHDGSGWLCRDEEGRRYRIARIRIGSDVFIGLGTILMPGVSIGNQCIVGSGSVVTRSVPDGYVVAGNPARKIGTFADFMTKAESWPSAADLTAGGKTRREQVDSITELDFRPPVA